MAHLIKYHITTVEGYTYRFLFFDFFKTAVAILETNQAMLKSISFLPGAMVQTHDHSSHNHKTRILAHCNRICCAHNKQFKSYIHQPTVTHSRKLLNFTYIVLQCAHRLAQYQDNNELIKSTTKKFQVPLIEAVGLSDQLAVL